MQRVTAADGHSFDCWVEPARGTVRGGLVIVQEIFGVTDQLKEVAAQYAEQGYAVGVPALFDRQGPGIVIPFDQAERARGLMAASNPDKVMADIGAAVAWLSAQGKVAVLGFCWGGGLAFRAAQSLPVACAVSFYGTRLQQYLDRPLLAPMQGHFGTEDSHAPADVLDKVRTRYPGLELHSYEGAGHAFANGHRPAGYDAAATELAHARAADFLARHMQ